MKRDDSQDEVLVIHNIKTASTEDQKTRFIGKTQWHEKVEEDQMWRKYEQMYCNPLKKGYICKKH